MKAARREKGRTRQSSGSRRNKSRRPDHSARIEAVQLLFEFMDLEPGKVRVH
jgi:hypothetical protein